MPQDLKCHLRPPRDLSDPGTPFTQTTTITTIITITIITTINIINTTNTVTKQAHSVILITLETQKFLSLTCGTSEASLSPLAPMTLRKGTKYASFETKHSTQYLITYILSLICFLTSYS